MSKSFSTAKCCNPFNKPRHSNKTGGLRPIMEWMRIKLPSLMLGSCLCASCRQELSKCPDPINALAAISTSDDDAEPLPSENTLVDTEMKAMDKDAAFSSLNKTLTIIGESPIDQRKLSQVKYPENKRRKVENSLKRNLFDIDGNPETETNTAKDETIILAQLKQKFSDPLTSRKEKVQILTILPMEWTLNKITSEFGATNYMAREVKQLVKEKGIMSTPDPKPGKVLSHTTADLVKAFYNDDEVSRPMPGKKDFVSVKSTEGRVHIQKRLILSNLRELFSLFKEKHSGQQIGFSKFAELRPKNCVLAGASGTHSVCVCTIHQNVKLMVEGGKLVHLTADDEHPLKTYKDCLAAIICKQPHPACYFNECDSCPGITPLKEHLQKLMDEEGIESVTYRQWVSVDRTTLEIITKSSDNYIDYLCEKLEKLLTHLFIAKQQSTYQNERKETLEEGEFLVICDFSENYSFVLQDAAQGFHWNNAQATLHPFVAYYKDHGTDTVEHVSYTIISDCLRHDTVAVHLFQKKLIHFLFDKFGKLPQKLIYCSDGAASQYKNRKNFINICFHEIDFQVKTEWHFSATSHGKGASDGIGGTVKRLAARASIQRPYNEQIMTPRQLYDWARVNIPAVAFDYCTIQEHDSEEKLLKGRFLQALTIPGTLKLHCILPISKSKISAKTYSYATQCKELKVSELDHHDEQEEEIVYNKNLVIGDLCGFVTCVYEGKWWPACVLSVDEDNEVVKVSFLHADPPSSTTSFKYPDQDDILNIPIIDVLTKIDPRTATGRSYTLSAKESLFAMQKLESWKDVST